VSHPDEEAPEADAVEQAALANPVDAADDEQEAPHPGMGVPEWDASEQAIMAPLDDERSASAE
jgi:hypothetical protein